MNRQLLSHLLSHPEQSEAPVLERSEGISLFRTYAVNRGESCTSFRRKHQTDASQYESLHCLEGCCDGPAETLRLHSASRRSAQHDRAPCPTPRRIAMHRTLSAQCQWCMLKVFLPRAAGPHHEPDLSIPLPTLDLPETLSGVQCGVSRRSTLLRRLRRLHHRCSPYQQVSGRDTAPLSTAGLPHQR